MKKTLLLFAHLFLVGFLHAQVKINVSLNPELKGPYTGRLFVHTLSDTAKAFTSQAMEEEPAFSIAVSKWKNGETRQVDKSSNFYIKPLDSLKPGYYKLIAILDTNTKERGNSAPGNLYTRNEVILHINQQGQGTANLVLNAEFRERPFKETEFVKEVKLPSTLLSAFRKEQILIKAAVILPPSYYKDTTKVYPVVYIIPGWGGTHVHGSLAGNQRTYGVGQGKEKIYVYLNPETQTPWGLHAFVDSRVNGPWGKAFVTEMIPFIQKKYRGSKSGNLTFITGQSSGGYGALWLALHYPTAFGGCWVTSPDPLDFSSFTGVNLYDDANYYTDNKGKERGFFLVNGGYKNTLRKTQQSETFAGDGGQQQSFEAEFGLPDQKGRPKNIFDIHTGKINKAVVQEWKPYDLALYVKNNWKTIGKYLDGKINVYAGEFDNFRLNESVKAFGEKAKQVNAKINVEIIPGADHFTTRSAALTTRIQSEMDRLIP